MQASWKPVIAKCQCGGNWVRSPCNTYFQGLLHTQAFLFRRPERGFRIWVWVRQHNATDVAGAWKISEKKALEHLPPTALRGSITVVCQEAHLQSNPLLHHHGSHAASYARLRTEQGSRCWRTVHDWRAAGHPGRSALITLPHLHEKFWKTKTKVTVVFFCQQITWPKEGVTVHQAWCRGSCCLCD